MPPARPDRWSLGSQGSGPSYRALGSSSPAPAAARTGRPAVRAPLLPALGSTRRRGTRRHRRGWQDRRSDRQGKPSPTAAASSASQVPGTRLVEVGPRRADMHRRPPRSASMVRIRWTPSPCGRLSRSRTTTGPPPLPTASAGDGPSRQPPGRWPVRAPPGWFPHSLSNPWTGSAPSCAHATSPRLRRVLHRGLPTGDITRPWSSPQAEPRGCALLPSPDPPGSSWWFRLEERSAAGSSRTPFRLLGPGQARLQATVDAVLPPSGVDRLGADPKRLGDLGDRPAGLDQVQHLAAELRRIAASSHATFLSGRVARNPTTRLHQTGGRPTRPGNRGRFRGPALSGSRFASCQQR
jgi:hypothetical protein